MAARRANPLAAAQGETGGISRGVEALSEWLPPPWWISRRNLCNESLRISPATIYNGRLGVAGKTSRAYLRKGSRRRKGIDPRKQTRSARARRRLRPRARRSFENRFRRCSLQ